MGIPRGSPHVGGVVDARARVPALDGLRAVAVGAVILTHAWTSAFPGGWVGVDVFFVLSGFLITGLLVAEHQRTGMVGLLAFYRRRAVRLLPAVLVMLAIIVPATALLHPDLAAATLHTALLSLVYAVNWDQAVHPAPIGFLTHLWSLSVEEQFYMAWPVVLIAMLWWRGIRLALGMTLVTIVAVVVHRTLLAGSIPVTDLQLCVRTDTRADSLLIGCALSLALALGWKGNPLVWRAAAMAGAAYLAIEILTARNAGGSRIAYTPLALSAAAIIGAIVAQPWPLLVRAMAWRPLVRVGRISYAVYLWHLPLMLLLPIVQGPALAGLTVALSLTAAELSARFVERPASRWRNARIRRTSTITAPIPVAA
jgi:peptidoglycan/LPS O-acetylase OafA/YrhL